MEFATITGLIAMVLILLMVLSFYDNVKLGDTKEILIVVLFFIIYLAWAFLVDLNYGALIYADKGDYIIYSDTLVGIIKQRLYIINGDTISSDNINRIVQ